MTQPSTIQLLRQANALARKALSGPPVSYSEWASLRDQTKAGIALERQRMRRRRDNLVGLAELAIHMVTQCDANDCIESGLQECEAIIQANRPKGLVQ